MRISDRQFVTFKRLQILTGVVPVGGFLFFHFAANGRAIAGREAYLAGTLPNDLPPLLKQLEVPLIAKPFDADILLNTVEAAAARLRARSDT